MSAGKSALFIDGQSLHHAAKALNFEVNYKRLLPEFKRRGPLLRANYYTTVFETEDFTAVRPLLDWLKYNGFTVRTMLLHEHDDGEGRRRWKRNIGVDLVIDAMETAGYVDNIYLFSGDGDFRSLVQALQRRGVSVTVVSTLRSKPTPMIADELRRQADAFLELDDLKVAISR